MRGKNALSKEGEEDILALGRCSVLPLILTLAWRAVKPSGCLVGGASAAAGLDMVSGRQQILLHCGPLHHVVFKICIFKVVPKITDLCRL